MLKLRRLANTMDIVGTIIVLFVILFEIQLTDWAKSEPLYTSFYEVNYKLDNIWQYSGYIGAKVLEEESGRIPISFETLNDAWPEPYLGNRFEDTLGTLFIKGNKIILLIGSILLATGRIMIARNNEKLLNNLAHQTS